MTSQTQAYAQYTFNGANERGYLRMLKLLIRLKKADNFLYAIQKILILVGVIAMVIINGAQVFCRYVLHSSLTWSEQVSVLLFFILIMLGANLAVKTDSETKVDILRFKNKRANSILHLLTDVLSIVALAVFIVSGFALLKHARKFPQFLSSIRLNYFYIYLWLPIGFGLVLFDKVINVLENICVLMGIDTSTSWNSEKEMEQVQS